LGCRVGVSRHVRRSLLDLHSLSDGGGVGGVDGEGGGEVPAVLKRFIEKLSMGVKIITH